MQVVFVECYQMRIQIPVSTEAAPGMHKTLGAFPSYTHPFCVLSFHAVLLKGLQASWQSWYMVIVQICTAQPQMKQKPFHPGAREI